ncbi:MAG: hypothetical protein H0V89_04620, partial [Deltaproteobacteria bacterium]|nr:hypothetical protein [Deltaproteobacteria bacterium]
MPQASSRRAGWLALAGLAVAPFWWSGHGPRGAAAVPPSPPVASETIVVDLLDGSSAAHLRAVGQRVGMELAWLDPRAEDEALAIGTSSEPARTVALLRADPRVEAVESVIELTALGYPDDPLYERQWNLRAMDAPAGWALTPRGRGIVVAVIDTGVAQVEDLAGTQVLEGAS